MRLKSFYGPTLSDAMRFVREALGDNAIIVSTRDDENGGVRVTAAIDDVAASTVPAHIETVDELSDSAAEVIEMLARTLLAHRTPNSVAERLLATATQFLNEDPLIVLGAAFDTHLAFQPMTDDTPGRFAVMIGPPGAGKTLCAAKIATRAKLAHRPISVISTDMERAGAVEQLAAFTRLLDTDLIEIEDSHALREAALMQPPQNLIIVDTPGLNPFVQDQRAQIEDYVSAAGGEAYLVMPAHVDPMEAIEMIAAYKACGANRLLITHGDIARRYGNLIHIAYETKMPLSMLASSSKVTEAPAPLNPVSFARLFLPRETQAELRPTGTDSVFSSLA